MALNTVSSDRLSTNVKTSNLGTELKKKLGQNKNLIINGAFQVAQRSTSSTTSGYGSVDRFKVEHSATDEAPTQAQVDVASGTTPYTSGFRKALKVTNGNQTSGAGASDYIYIQHNIEAQNVATSGWNYTSASSYITFSFWVKSSVAQSFKVYLRSKDTTEQRYTFDTGSLTADTWTKITKTIPGNSNLVFNNDNGQGLQINILAFMGGTFTDNSVTEDAWAAYASGTRTKDNTSTWYTTNDATLEITGLQLEVGSVATDFEHRSFGEELNLCKRYCQVLQTNVSSGSPYTRFAPAIMQTTSSVRCIFYLSPEMRAKPSGAISGNFQIFPATGFSSGSFALETGTTTFNTAIMQQSSGMSGTAGSAHFFSANGDATAKVTFDAEL